MKFYRLPIFENIISNFGIQGAFMFVISGLLCLIITVWMAMILIGNTMILGNPWNFNQSTIEIRLFYSIISVILGFISANLLLKLAMFCDKKASESHTKIP